MRIVSLVPSATESLFALGLGADVVAVTHECDWPAEATRLPHVTRSVLEAGLAPAEVDRRVRELTEGGEPIYGLDVDALERLKPDLIVTQELCAVCAVSYDDVCRAADALPSRPEVLSLDPKTLDEVLADLPRLAATCNVTDRGNRLSGELRSRLARVEESVREAARPRALALEWMDPPYVGGHWVPDMVEMAGGTDVAGIAGTRSRVATVEELVASHPDVIVCMPCGLYADDAAGQARDQTNLIRAIGAQRVFAVDAASSFSRPGPRLVDGIELLAHLLHPELAPAPDSLAWSELAELGRSRGSGVLSRRD